MRKVTIVLISVAALIAVAVWVLSLESTLQWIVGRGVQRSGGKLEVAGTTGSLLYGPIGFTELRYRAPGMDVAAQRGRIELARWPLLAKHVVLHRVDVETLAIEPHPAAPSPSAKLPQRLQLPVRVSVNELHVNRIELRTASGPTVGPLTASMQLQPQMWSAQINSLQTMIGNATADAQVATSSPFALSGTFALTSPQPVYDAKAQLSGTLERIIVHADGQASQAHATANATLTPFAAGALEHIDLSARAVDPRYFRATAPSANISLDVTSDRDPNSERMRGMLDITNSAAGAWDEDKLPVVKVTGKAKGTAADLLLSALLLDFGTAGKLAGDGRLRGRKLDLDLVTRRLDLHRLHGRLRPTQLAGTIRAKASQDKQRVTLNLTEKNGRIDAAIRIDKRSLTVEQVRASAAGGSVIAHGKLDLEGDRPLAFKGTVTNFDPSYFGKYPRARINSRFDATGALAPILQLTADLDVFDSQVNGAATAGKIRWHSKGTQTPDIAVDLVADVGETHARAQGTLFDPIHVGKLDIQLSLQGKDLADLFPILGIPLPPTPPYQLSGHLRHHEDVWTFHQFSGKVGQSDLAGDFTLDRGQRVQVLRADLVSNNLRLADLGGFIGARGDDKRPAKHEKGRPVLPNEPFNLEKIRSTQADVRFSGRHIITQAVPIDNMTAHLQMSHGVVTIDPLDFGMGGGNVVGKVTLDANQSVIAGTADVQIKELHLERLVPKAKSTKASVGTMQGRALLSGTGNSVAAMLGTSNGRVTVVMDGGEISELVLRLLNLDVAHTLVTVVRGDESVPVRCMVGYFAGQHGHLKPQPFILDTEHTKVVMEGDIDLGTEQLNLRLIAQPKDMSLVSLRGPIVIDGPFSSPSVHPDLKQTIARSIAAIALGIVATPVAAIVPFFEIGTAKDANCKAIVTQAKALIDDQAGARPPSPDATEAAGSSRKEGG